MGKESSFDVVSEFDLHGLQDAVNIANKEIQNRYDFKGTKSSIELDAANNVLMLKSSDAYKVKALYEVLTGRAAKRGLPIKNLEPGKIEEALGGTAKQVVTVHSGISKEKGKKIVEAIKNSGLKKVKGSIQDEKVRVTSPSRDALQELMTYLKGKDFGLALQFENYR